MKKYRSNISSPEILRLLLSGGLFLLVAVIIRQIRGDRFPLYADFLIVLLIALGVYALLWFVAILMPITVKLKGIKCYDTQGLYKEIKWSEVKVVTMVKLYGLPYACIESESLTCPITVPLYLDKMEDFKETVCQYAGLDNPLSEFLQNEI